MGVCLVIGPRGSRGIRGRLPGQKHVIAMFPHVFIGGPSQRVPVEGFVFQPSRVFGPGSDNGTDTG